MANSNQLLTEILARFPEADPSSEFFNEDINGCDAVDFISEFIPRVKECLALAGASPEVAIGYRVEEPEDKIFVFSIDPVLFKKQRTLFTQLLDGEEKDPSIDFEPLEGIRDLLDTIADQAHDVYGMDTLFCLNSEEEEG